MYSEVAQVDARFAMLSIDNLAHAHAHLSSSGFRPMSVADMGRLRLALGPYHKVSWTGAWTTDFFVAEEEAHHLVRVGDGSEELLSQLYEGMVDSHSDRRESVASRLVLAHADSMITVPLDGGLINVNEFSSSSLAQWLFESQTEEYADWLLEIGIGSLPIALPAYSLLRTADPGLARPLILRCTDNWSGIITANADSHNPYGMWGWSDAWRGDVLPEELYHLEESSPFGKMLDLDPGVYPISRLVSDSVSRFGHGVTGVMVRALRSGSRSTLPANYSTWERSETT